MNSPHSIADLAKEWVHSHEEDTHGLQVYRTPGYAFPAARGRDGMALGADGRVDAIGSGAVDRSVRAAAGSWALHGDRITLHRPDAASTPFTIESLEPDRLVLRPTR